MDIRSVLKEFRLTGSLLLVFLPQPLFISNSILPAIGNPVPEGVIGKPSPWEILANVDSHRIRERSHIT